MGISCPLGDASCWPSHPGYWISQSKFIKLRRRAPWAAGRSKPLSMAHCLKTWRISWSPLGPREWFVEHQKKNTQQSLLNKTGSHWKVTEIRSEIVILNPQDWIPYCRSLMDINGLYGRSTTSWWGFVQKFLAVLSFIFSMLSSNSGRKMVIFVGGYLIKMMVLNDKSICECPWL